MNETEKPETAGTTEAAQPSEEELREQLEEEIRKVRIEDLLLQSVVSVLNLTARRIAKDDERDLDQARMGIDACRALVDLLPDEAATQVREALSELQMLYAKHAKEGGEEPGGPAGEQKTEEPAGEPKKNDPKEGGSGLWTPGSST
jgi:hypothetical protein